MRVLSGDHVSKTDFDSLKNTVDRKQNRLILVNLLLNLINLGLIIFIIVK